VQPAAAIADVFRAERARVLATTIRVCNGDFELAEEAVQDAFAAALSRWPSEGTPTEPRGWLVTVARHKAIDQIRRRSKLREIGGGEASPELYEPEPQAVQDDRLRLIFTCCHPALAPEAQVALTLRTLGGLETEEIARAFLVPAATMAQRLVRAKAKIRQAGIPYRVPDSDELPARLDAVLAVIYLVFNEGYAASSGSSPVRREICEEAIRLGRLLVELMPAAEARALLALMLLSDARRDARVGAGADGEVILLEDQDRSRWDRAAIREGLALIDGTLRAVDGTYQAYGQKLAIDRGILGFTGTVENPRLDIEASRPDLDVRVGVIVSGTALAPRIRLFSEPEMSELDKLSWLVVGRASETVGGADTALLQRAALALLSGEGPGVTDRLTKAIGLDEISVHQGAGEVKDTIVSLGKQISKRWYVGYERGLNATTGSWQLVYRIAQRLTIRAEAGGDNAVDLTWTLRWR